MVDIDIAGIEIDSRKVGKDSLFAAIKGTQVDGHRFIDTAIKNGASAILCEDLPDALNPEVTYLQTLDCAEALGRMAAEFYENPSQNLVLIGITGTNGKTSTATLLKNAVSNMGHKAGLISTVQIEIGDQIIPATHTTPDAVSLQRLLAQMVESDCEYVFMEASSHAIDQKRIAGLNFRGAVFTNITHDHLDYHKTFDHYLKAKKRLFDILPSKAFALVNADDKNGKVMVQNSKAKKLTYSLRTLADYRAKILEQDFTSMQLELNGREVYTPISGTFNAYNISAVFGTLDQLGFNTEEILVALSQSRGAEGRLEWIKNHKNQVGIVDYAHTPDALENVLKSIKQINTSNGAIITVVGCGGDRDREKRPKMARIACELSDKVILTSDNPRSEDPETIITEMEKGIPIHKKLNVLSISDRKNAIKTACSLSQEGDLILVAGKGHEKYQDIKGEKHPFDDKAVLQEFLIPENN